MHAAVLAGPGRTAQLINVSRAAIDGDDVLNSTLQTITGILWYHIFRTNCVLQVLNDQPFDNRGCVTSARAATSS